MAGTFNPTSIQANHACGFTCDQFSNGICTHGCYAGGAPNPDFNAGQGQTNQSVPAELTTDGGNVTQAQQTVVKYNNLSVPGYDYKIDSQLKVFQSIPDLGASGVTVSDYRTALAANTTLAAGAAAAGAAFTTKNAADCAAITVESERRLCLVNATSGLYTSGDCLGKTVDECSKIPGRRVQYCSGSQITTSDTSGEFRSNCGTSSGTGGCGQIDIYDYSVPPILKGFIIDKSGSNCGGPSSPGTPTTQTTTLSEPTPTPSTPPIGPTPTPTPMPIPTFQCQQIQILRGGVVITPSQILLNDNIVFRGFASATNTTVSSMLFTITINAVAQTPVSRPATLVSGQYQADYPYAISQATSYSASVVPVSP